MTINGEQQEIDRLCKAVIEEKDPAKLAERVAALSDFLEHREQRKLADSKLPKQA